MRLFRPAALAVAGLLAVSACSGTSTSTAPQDKALGSTKPATAAPTTTVLNFPKVSNRDLARVTYPGKGTTIEPVPSQHSYHVVIACIASEPNATLDWELIGTVGGGGPISCNGKEDSLESSVPLTGGQIGIRFKNKSDKVTRAYAVLRSGSQALLAPS